MYVRAITPHARQRLEHRSAEIGLDANVMYKTLADCLNRIKTPSAIVLGVTNTHRLVAIAEIDQSGTGELIVKTVLKLRIDYPLSNTTANHFCRAEDILK